MKFSKHPLAEPLRGIPATVDQPLIQRLRLSLARLLAKDTALAEAFYATLFSRHPELRPLFPADMSAQKVKLTEMLAWIVSGLDRPDQTLAEIADMGRRHVDYGAKAEHYPLVRDALITAMAQVAGTDWSETLADDWRQTINQIARHMVAAATGQLPEGRPTPPSATASR